MSFAEMETSVERGAPITIYLFKTGPGDKDYIAYTDAERTVQVGSIEYEPMPIDRNEINVTGTLDKSSLEVKTSRYSSIADLFRVYPPSFVVGLTIREGHVGDDDNQFLLIWSGRVLNCMADGMIATLTCEPIATSLGRPGLRRNYQYGCPHVLYGTEEGGCQAPKVPRVAPILSIISGNVLAIPRTALGATPAAFLNGTVEWVGAEGRTEVRNIFKVVQGPDDIRLTISGMTTGMVTGSNLKILLGCNHTTEDCSKLFNNILNYGGQPWIPLKNPIGKLTTFL